MLNRCPRGVGGVGWAGGLAEQPGCDGGVVAQERGGEVLWQLELGARCGRAPVAPRGPDVEFWLDGGLGLGQYVLVRVVKNTHPLELLLVQCA